VRLIGSGLDCSAIPDVFVCPKLQAAVCARAGADRQAAVHAVHMSACVPLVLAQNLKYNNPQAAV